jgi:hypothetical protein
MPSHGSALPAGGTQYENFLIKVCHVDTSFVLRNFPDVKNWFAALEESRYANTPSSRAFCCRLTSRCLARFKREQYQPETDNL